MPQLDRPSATLFWCKSPAMVSDRPTLRAATTMGASEELPCNGARVKPDRLGSMVQWSRTNQLGAPLVSTSSHQPDRTACPNLDQIEFLCISIRFPSASSFSLLRVVLQQRMALDMRAVSSLQLILFRFCQNGWLVTFSTTSINPPARRQILTQGHENECTK